MIRHPRLSLAATILVALVVQRVWTASAAAQAPAPQPESAEPSTPRASADEAVALEALVANATHDIEEVTEPSLRLSGFADFSATSNFHDSTNLNGANEGHGAQFLVGNLNLYVDADLTAGWHSMIEVRYTYLPNGGINFGGGEISRTSTQTGDYIDNGRPLRWGTIIIERAFLEYTIHSLLTIRVGHFITPMGIWNVDHGSPTVVSVRRPYIINEGLIPTAQTGFELYGSRTIHRWTLGYHFTVSNGRGPTDTHLDLDHDKGLGGRLFGRLEALGSLTLGASVYRGRATYAGIGLDPSSMKLTKNITSQFDEVGYGMDLQWEWEGLLLQTEVLGNDVVYTRDGRPSPTPPTGNPGLVPDSRRWGMYLLAGYRLPWLGIMPYVLYERTESGTTVPVLGSPIVGKTTGLRVGLNIRPTSNVTLKAEWAYADLPGTADSPFPAPGSEMDYANFQAAWSF